MLFFLFPRVNSFAVLRHRSGTCCGPTTVSFERSRTCFQLQAMAGGMEVHTNKFVEQWASNRENLELAFRFNRRTIPICLTFGVFLPVLTYYGIVAEFKKQDKLEGRSRRFLGD